MSDIAIRVNGLSKLYQIGEKLPYRTLRESLMQLVTAPARWLGNRSNRGSRNENDDTIWALEDVSFEVRRGEVLAIIGRNGAGKSTLLKILSRITEPTGGYADVYGRVGSLLEIGTGFHNELTGRENIYLNGGVLGMTRAEIVRKFDEIVDFAGVERFIDTPVKRYSSGMKVRLGFAVAAHLEPEILLVDEVLAVGDIEFQRKCLGAMSDVARGGRTVLFVSHNMAAIEGLCTQAVLLDRGRVAKAGSVSDTIADYLQRSSDQLSCEVDLRQHPNRVIDKCHVFSKLRLTDDLGRTLPGVQLGQPVTFEIELDARRRLSAVRVGIHFYDVYGRRVATCHSAYQTTARLDLEGRRTLRCRIPSWRLIDGEYTVVLGLTTNDDQVDRIDPALRFEVTPRDIYGTGKVPPRRDGVYVPEASWVLADQVIAREFPASEQE